MEKRTASILALGLSVLLWSSAAAHAQYDMIVTNLAGLAQQAFDSDHCLYLPWFTPCEYQGVSLDGGLAWWVDCSQMPCTNLPPALTDESANALLSGVTLMPMQLTWNILTGEAILQPYGSTNVVAVIPAPSGYEPGGYSYDAGVWSAWQQMTNCPDCWGIEGDVPPPTVSLAVYLADISQYSIYESNCEAQAEAYAAATTASETSMMSGHFFMSMDDDDGGGDPCTLTNLLQAFFVTNIVPNATGSTTITWESCQFLRYLVFTASSLSTNTQWVPQAYVWGQTNSSWTSWTDTATTNDDGSTITERFYRVQRLLGASLAAGDEHGLLVQTNGALWGWGFNIDGEVGDGTTTERSNAVLVAPYPCGDSPLPTHTVAVAAGTEFSAAVDSNGNLWTWGSNSSGQLGNGAGSESIYVPTLMTGISNVVSVAAGYDFMIALTANRTVWAWGDNGSGELGIGGPPPYSTNSPMMVTTQIVAIAAGVYFSVALDAGGNVWAWGYGDDGEIGNGGGTNAATPTMVTNISNVIAIAAGVAHVVALTSSNTVWTWGDNTAGELGLGYTGGNETVPTQVSGLSNVVAIAAGYAFSLAVTSNGLVYAWGYNNDGQLGTNSSAVSSTNLPMLVPGVSNAVVVAANPDGFTSLAETIVHGTNMFWGWGNDNDSEIGNGTSVPEQDEPSEVQFSNPTNECSCYQLGTTGTFTAYATGTLYLFFNDDGFGDNAGAYTTTVYQASSDIVVGSSNVVVVASNSVGIAVGPVTNGVTYSFTASGRCSWATFDCQTSANNPDCTTDANGNHSDGQPADCVSANWNQYGAAICPLAQCFSLVGKIE